MLQNFRLWEALVPLDHFASQGCAAVGVAKTESARSLWSILQGTTTPVTRDEIIFWFSFLNSPGLGHYVLALSFRLCVGREESCLLNKPEMSGERAARGIQ